MSKYFFKSIIQLSISFIFFIFSTSSCLAIKEFNTDFHSEYKVNPEGITQVTHTITLTNLFTHLYTTEYTLFINTPNISQLKVTQDNTETQYINNKSERGVNITLKHLHPVIGQGQSTTLIISYQTPDLVEHLNNTWSINIPRLAKANETSTFIRTIILPQNLGKPSVQFPKATSLTTQNKLIILTYKGHPNNSISLLFGDYEIYHLNLTYQINNPTLSNTNTEIALPPDTTYQQAILDSIKPQPKYIRTDKDGNWLATYNLKANQSLKIEASLYLKIFAQPQTKTKLNNPSLWLNKTKFWDTTNPKITQLAKQLNTPLNIYNYLIDNLHYDSSKLQNKIKRLGAVQTLNHPQSTICTEYTDLFVTLARANHIPARELNGYAYTHNKTLRPLGVASADILHAWPEYYSSKESTWIQIDPTWADTTGGIDYFHKLDFNHLVFVIHGIEDNYPLPAGAYKTDPKLSTIQIEPVDQLPPITKDLQHNNKIIKNMGNTSVNHPQYGYLPPLGEYQLNLSLDHTKTSLIPNFFSILLFIIIGFIVFPLIRHFKH